MFPLLHDYLAAVAEELHKYGVKLFGHHSVNLVHRYSTREEMRHVMVDIDHELDDMRTHRSRLNYINRVEPVGVTGVLRLESDRPPQVYINQVWLDKLGLEMPTDWDSPVSLLRAFKNGDPNPPDDVYDIYDHSDRLYRDLSRLYGEASEKNNPRITHFVPPFTEEEEKENGTIRTDVGTYITASVAQFVVGDLDINDDKTWNDYIKTIESMGIKTLLDNAQAAYDRSYGSRG